MNVKRGSSTIDINESVLNFLMRALGQLASSLQDSPTIFHTEGEDIKIRYHIGKRIDGNNRTLFSQVRVCTLRDSDTKFAVKTYALSGATFSPDGKQIIFSNKPGLTFNSIVNEITVMARLKHSLVTCLYEVYYDSKYVHLVMELNRGGELYDLLAKERTLSEKRAGDLLSQILEAVRYMHGEGYCHRALCIENIMFGDREREEIKIIGLSSSTKIGDEPLREKYGNPMYMAPEVFSGSYNERCDIWSVGVILYTMLIGHQPFYGKDLQEIIKSVMKGSYPKDVAFNNLKFEMKNNIVSMLSTNRPSANDLLHSPLLNRRRNSILPHLRLSTKKLANTELGEIIEEIYADRLRVAVYQALIRNHMLEEDLSEYDKLFKELDYDSRGYVAEDLIREGLQNFLQKVVHEDSEEYLDNLINRMDTMSTGKIGYDEFMSAFSSEVVQPEKLALAFSTFDVRGVNLLDYLDFARITNNENDLDSWRMLVDRHDIENRGGWSVQEFKNFIIKYGSN
jgi:calcium-dependent protein kinase